MNITPDEARKLLYRERFPRSNAYDPEWLMANQMGPNVLWLAEIANEFLDLKPGMRLLDLGPGAALSSIFFAKEFGVQVWSAEYWLKPSQNLERIREAGLEDQVFPIHCDANKLPFAHDYFDAIVCLDAFQYFGYPDDYLPKLAAVAKSGAPIAVIIPTFTEELDEVPEHLDRTQPDGSRFWCEECENWHHPGWWQQQWSSHECVRDVNAELIEGGWQLWRDFEEIGIRAGMPMHLMDEAPNPHFLTPIEEDGGRYLGLMLLTACKA